MLICSFLKLSSLHILLSLLTLGRTLCDDYHTSRGHKCNIKSSLTNRGTLIRSDKIKQIGDLSNKNFKTIREYSSAIFFFNQNPQFINRIQNF